MSKWRLLGTAAWCGIVVPAAIAASTVAWMFGHAPELGEPIATGLYNPLEALAWWNAWGSDEPYRGKFLTGIALAFAPGVLAAGSLAVRMMQQLPMRRSDPDEQLGTARELRKRGDVRVSGDGVVIGKHGRDVLRVSGDQHVLVLGPSGSGKGVGTVIPTLLEHNGSMIVNDMKGELAHVTGRWRSTLGPTWIFDATDRHSHAFNPLIELRGGDYLHGDCMAAATLIAKSGTAKDPVWENAAAELLTALLLVAFERGQPTLSVVHDLVLEVSANQHPATRNHHAQLILDAHMKLEDRVRSSVNFETRTSMAFMSDPVVRAVTSRSEFRAGDMFCGDRPTTIFVTVPPAQQERLRPLTRLIVQVLTNAALHSLAHTSDGRDKTREALFLLDEFPSLRRMESLELGVAVARGYGVRYMLVAQDGAQIERAYSDKQSITANMGTIVLLPGFSARTLEMVAAWAGWSLQTARSRGREIMKPLSVRSQESEDRRPVLNPADMLSKQNAALVSHLGCKPAWIERVRYFAEPRWRGRYDEVQ